MHEGSALSIIEPDWLAPNNVFALVTTRVGGVSTSPYDTFNLGDHVDDDPLAVTQNRQRLSSLFPSEVSVQWLNQVHGVNVIVAGHETEIPEADGAITLSSGQAIAILTADCLPALFCDSAGTCVGAAHAGWRGLANGVLEKTIDAFPGQADQIHVWLGPAIGACHFEVGSEVRDAFLSGSHSSEQLAQLSKCFTATTECGKFYADLYAIARIRLKAAGVMSISGGGYCTFCDTKRFYSFRREPITGRFASIIGIKPVI